MHPTGRGHTCAAAKPHAHPLEQVAEMVADDIRRLEKTYAPVIVAWLLPFAVPTVYCAKCIDATQAQRDLWAMIEAGAHWPAPCSFCGKAVP